MRSGRWIRVGRGAYMSTVTLERAEGSYEREAMLHRGWAIATARRHADAVISHHSAAVIHGLPLWGRMPTVASLIVPPGHWTGTRGTVRYRSVGLAPSDVITMHDSAVTSIARTWCDVARTSRLGVALSVGDAALRSGQLTLSAAAGQVELAAGLPGVRRAAQALTHLDALRETPLESASWAYFVRYGLPLPRMQVVIVDDGGSVVARVDFLWDEFDLVGECDGRIKYTDRNDLYREKRREDTIRQLGFDVIRWGAQDLLTGDLATRIRYLTGRRRAA